MEPHPIRISDYDYPLPEERIAKFPLERREASKLLLYRKGSVSHTQFAELGKYLPQDSLLVFNNTKVIRARLVFHKQTGARVEIFCLEPHDPADYERAFAVKGRCRWQCIVGNLKKWKDAPLSIRFETDGKEAVLTARRIGNGGREQIVEFEWNTGQTFGQLLETLGRIPIPPYLCRESEDSDNIRYQTVYSKFEGSVAAPTAGLHFTPEIIGSLQGAGHECAEVTLHVGAGTFLPVKAADATQHEMHTEHFEVSTGTLHSLISNFGKTVAVGTTSVRTLESLNVLGYRILRGGDPEAVIEQWDIYDIPEQTDGRTLLDALAAYMERRKLTKLKAATRIMIMPGYRFRIVNGIITNFHQPQSTLLLLVSAFIGEDWKKAYDYALENGFRFLSYGDSSLLLP